MSPATLFAVVATLVISAVPALAVLLLSVRRSNAKRKAATTTTKLPPGEMGWPVIGSSVAFLRPHPATALGDYMTQKIAKYGRLFTTRLFGRALIVSADAELNRHVLNNDLRLFEGAWPSHVPRLIGKHAMSMIAGDAHKQKKAAVLSLMSSVKTQPSFIRDIERRAAALVADWKGRDVLYCANEALKFAFYVISKKALGMNPNNPKADELRKAFVDVQRGLSSIPINLPGTTYYKALKGRAYIVKTIEQTLEESRRNENKAVEEDDFAGWILKNTSFSTEEKIDLIGGLIFGGHYTIARTISLALYFLGRCPKAVQQMREERVRCLKYCKSEDGESNLTWDDYKNSVFTQNVISETLRLGNVVRLLFRKATVDIEYKGYVIPQGTTVLLHLPATHLNESVFEDPYEFNPWRWETLSDTQKNSFMPFGGGLRYCPGRDIARMEIAIFLHTVIQNHNLELIGQDHPTAKLQINFANRLPIKLKPVNQSTHVDH